MKQGGKASVIILVILTVLVGGVAVGAIALQIQERDRRIATEQKLLVVTKMKDDLEDQLNELKGVKEALEGDLAQTKQEIVTLTEELAGEREARETLAQSIDDREREITRISKDLEQIRTERTELTQQVTKLQSQQEQLQKDLAQIQNAKQQLELKVQQLTAGEQPTVELEKVVVTGEETTGTSVSSTTLEGQVVVVNREYDFIVMNLGKNQGLEIGQEFQIVRGDEVLGRVKVEKIYDELSAAAILPNSQKEAIREGDLVKSL